MAAIPTTDAVSALTTEVKRFDGRVFHVHCDPMLTPESLQFDFPSTSDNKFGTIAPELFIVINSPDLLLAVQKQLQNHCNAQYSAQSVTFQLGDAEGALGSEMISDNLAHRLTQALNVVRNAACAAYKEHYAMGAMTGHVNFVPTAAGLRIYPKLPEVKGDKAATDRKVRELAVKYGAVPDEDGAARDMNDLSVAIKVNIFGFYKGAYYLNYRLVAPFRTKTKPEILAETKKAPRKRATSTAPRKPRASSMVDFEAVAAEGEGATKRKLEAPGAPKKRARPVGALEAASVDIDPSDYATEDDLALAYIKAGVPLRQATQQAMKHFMETEDASSSAPVFTAVSRTLSAGNPVDERGNPIDLDENGNQVLSAGVPRQYTM